MRMHAVWTRGIILENYFDGIAHLGLNQRPENSEVHPAVAPELQRPETGVGILAKTCFTIYGRVCIQFPFRVGNVLEVEFLPCYLVRMGWRVVPIDFISCDVVVADSPAMLRFGFIGAERSKRKHDAEEDERTRDAAQIPPPMSAESYCCREVMV